MAPLRKRNLIAHEMVQEFVTDRLNSAVGTGNATN